MERFANSLDKFSLKRIVVWQAQSEITRNYSRAERRLLHEAVFYFSKFVQMRALFADELRVEGEAKMGEKGRRRRRREQGKACVSDH